MKHRLMMSLATALSLTAINAIADEPSQHHGFHFRGTIGGGYLYNDESGGKNGDSIGGNSVIAELYLGGYVSPGIAIGGYITDMVAPTVNIYDQTVSLGLATIGPYFDFYDTANSGFHFLLTPGFAGFSACGTTCVGASGYGMGVGVGYDWPMHNGWSLGILARAIYSHTKYNPTYYENSVAPALLFSISFH